MRNNKGEKESMTDNRVCLYISTVFESFSCLSRAEYAMPLRSCCDNKQKSEYLAR